MYKEKRRWTARQVNFLVLNWDIMKDEEIAEALGKTVKSVRRKRERMELRKDSGRGIVRPMSKENKFYNDKQPPVYQLLPERKIDN